VTLFQILSLAVLGVVVLWQFALPKVSGFRLPQQDSTLRHLESVIKIRDSSKSDEVKAACNSLLQALLK
jgi:hypothetical protein